MLWTIIPYGQLLQINNIDWVRHVALHVGQMPIMRKMPNVGRYIGFDHIDRPLVVFLFYVFFLFQVILPSYQLLQINSNLNWFRLVALHVGQTNPFLLFRIFYKVDRFMQTFNGICETLCYNLVLYFKTSE